MSGLRVGQRELVEAGMRLPGLAERAAALQQLPPLGLLTIAAVVPDHWQVQLLADNGPGDQSVQDTLERIRETEPDLVAFSALSPAIDRAKAIGQGLRRLSVPTVIGGLHATALAEDVAGHFDAVVCGDGEETFARLLDDFSQGNLAKQYRATAPFNLSRSPLPRWDLLGDHAPPRYTMQTQRGCPWACSFCAASRLLGPARAKPLERIAAELQAIQQRQSRPWVELADDNTFAVDRDQEAMLALFQDAGMRWFTESDWRIGHRPQLLRLIADSGCQQILIGVESSVFRYPGMGRKAAELSEITEACLAIQQAGIIVNACFIVGADGETEGSIERLGEYLQTAPFGEIQLTVQTPFPGSSLYRLLQRQGRLLDDDFSRYTLFDVVYRPDQMSAATLQRCFERLVVTSFSAASESRRRRIRKSVRRNRRQRF